MAPAPSQTETTYVVPPAGGGSAGGAGV